MKIKELMDKIDDKKVVLINGKPYDENLLKEILENEVIKINIETKKTSGNDLESLGYSFDVGV